jgi:intracellular septation protein
MDEPARPRPNPLLKLCIELGPLLLFFAVFSKWGIYAATGVFMVTSVLSLVFAWVTERRIPPMPLITAVIVLVFGGLTLWLHDDTFTKLKLTVINGLFGLVLGVGLLLRKPLVKHLFGDALQLADEGWRRLTWIWMGYFFGIAALNEAVWRNTTTETWVTFKTFALPILSLVFLFGALGPVIARYDQSPKEPGEKPSSGT